MKSPRILLLASAVLLASTTAQQPAHAVESTHALKLAQAAPQGEKNEHGHKRGHVEKKGKPAHNPQIKGHGKPGSAEHKAERKHAKPAATEAKPRSTPAAAAREEPHHAHLRPANKRPGKEQHQHSENRQRHENGKRPPVAQAARKETPATARTEHKKAKQTKSEHRQPNRPKESAKPARPTKKQVEQHKGAHPSAQPAGKSAERPSHHAPKATRQQRPTARRPAAAQTEAPTAGRTNNRNAKQAKPEHRQPNQPKESAKPARPTRKQVEQRKGAQPSSAPAGKSAQQPAALNAPTTAAAPPPPTKPRSASSFILRQGEKPAQGLNTVRRSRHETREGNRLVIREGDRTIEREDNHAIIRHNASGRFAVGARHVEVKHHGDRTVTVVVRPNGVRIVSTTDRYGHLIRRVRRDPHGREIVIINDSRFAPRRRDELFVDVPPPRIRHRDRHILEADRADRRRIYEFLTARPIERLRRHYTVDQVRYNYPLREYMPRVDLDIHFDTGSWQLTPDQIDRLGEIAAALNEAIDRNPREVYLIEGYTDAVGSWEDNLSLSDRRAEAVAVALTEEFHVPPENLVTQGYGEEHLKVQTQGPSRANRRVTVQRITPLIAEGESQDRR